MKTPIRRRLGIATMITSAVAALALHVSGVPLLTLIGIQNSSSPGGQAVTLLCYKMHWSLLAVCVAALIGLVAAVWPKPTPPVLRP
jgi:hypothetical protein